MAGWLQAVACCLHLGASRHRGTTRQPANACLPTPPAFCRPPCLPQVAILDGQCNLLPPGEVGEVCILGPNVTKGYLDNPTANEEAFAGGRLPGQQPGPCFSGA